MMFTKRITTRKAAMTTKKASTTPTINEKFKIIQVDGSKESTCFKELNPIINGIFYFYLCKSKMI